MRRLEYLSLLHRRLRNSCLLSESRPTHARSLQQQHDYKCSIFHVNNYSSRTHFSKKMDSLGGLQGGKKPQCSLVCKQLNSRR